MSARFDEDTKASFLDLYTKIDAGVLTSEDTDTEDTEENASKKNYVWGVEKYFQLPIYNTKMPMMGLQFNLGLVKEI